MHHNTGEFVLFPIHQLLYQKFALGGAVTKSYLALLHFRCRHTNRHTNLVVMKGFNLVDERAARCIHMSFQEEELKSSS